MIICGKNSVIEAISSGQKIYEIYVQKGINGHNDIVDKANESDIKVIFCDKLKMDNLTKERHQGVVAKIQEFNYSSVEEILAKRKNKNALILVLDGIEDPHNLGSIIRVAECAGFDGIIIPKHRAVEVNATVMKISAGAVNHTRIALVTNINDTLRELNDKFFNILCADMDGENIYKSKLSGDIALVIGGEGNGIKPLTKKLCSKVVSIPQFGKVNSLNASVACGIVAFEIVRQINF